MTDHPRAAPYRARIVRTYEAATACTEPRDGELLRDPLIDHVGRLAREVEALAPRMSPEMRLLTKRVLTLATEEVCATRTGGSERDEHLRLFDLAVGSRSLLALRERSGPLENSSADHHGRGDDAPRENETRGGRPCPPPHEREVH